MHRDADAPSCSPPPRRSTLFGPSPTSSASTTSSPRGGPRPTAHSPAGSMATSSGARANETPCCGGVPSTTSIRRAVGRTPTAITTRPPRPRRPCHRRQPRCPLGRHRRLNGWPIRSLDKPDSVPTMGGLELQDLFRPFLRPELIPNADVTVSGLEHIPREGGAIIVGNHRATSTRP